MQKWAKVGFIVEMLLVAKLESLTEVRYCLFSPDPAWSAFLLSHHRPRGIHQFRRSVGLPSRAQGTFSMRT